ncbi:MAG: hypothetical protein RLY31_2750 [Bacteroidota bacterium]|jgi:rhodanese-related sulfurtransferase
MLTFLKKLFGGPSGPGMQELLDQGAVIIDVRSREEFKAGHAKGATNIPLQELGGQLNRLAKQNKPVVTCCASGRRSGIAARQLQAAGISCANGGPWQRVAHAIGK